MSTPTVNHLFTLPDNLSNILKFVKWEILIKLSAISIQFHRKAQLEVKRRLEMACADILLELGVSLDAWLGMLRDVDGMVIGALARRVLMLHREEAEVEPALRSVSIAVGSGRLEQAKEWFQEKGYDKWDAQEVLKSARPCVEGVIVGRKQGRYKDITVRLVESKGRGVVALTGCPSSYDMIGFTDKIVIALFPGHFYRDVAVISRDATGGNIGQINPRYRVSDNNADWRFDCLKSCPAVWRRMRREDGVGVFFYDMDEELALMEEAPAWDANDRATAARNVDKDWVVAVEKKEGLRDDLCKLRMVGKCFNRRCPNFHENQ